MSIFRRDTPSGSHPASSSASDSGSFPAARPQQRRVTHIAPGSHVEGELTGPTELLIEGEVEGEIRVDSTVMVGSEGLVVGPISAQVVRIVGRVVGNVHGSERVEVAPSGSVEGDIAAPRVVIAEGAFFKGRVEMKSEPERTTTNTPPVEPGKA